MKKKKFLVADLLCGAGGSSTGASQAFEAMGLEMELVCVNHWPVAIDTHQRNHPHARHFVQDIATVRPSELVPEGYLDLLMASPTCTHHSNARGGKPTSDQQRSDPWHIITWLTELRVKRIIIENVWEFVGWGPVDHRTGRPVQSRKGEYFHAWIETLKRLGFDPEWRKLNAADYGDATTRQRFILMARSDGRKVHWPMPSHKKKSLTDADLFAAEKPWRPAREIIDWSIKGRSIFQRPKPLAPKTLLRIYSGAVKHEWPEPFIVVLRNHMSSQGIDTPIPTIAAKGQHIALAEPVVISPRHGKEGAGPRPRGTEQPLPTITAGGSQFAVAQPVVVNMKGKSKASGVDLPLPTQTAHAPHLYTAEPIVLSQNSFGVARSTEDPLPTITTGGAGTDRRPGCARPMLIEPFVLSQASCGAPRAVSDPLPSSTTGGRGGSHALIAPYYGSGSGESCSSATKPLPTLTAKARFGMVVPVTQSNGGAIARDVAEPLPTITTAKGGEFAVVQPVPYDAENTPCADELEYDILFRMLEPHELAGAMGFDGYQFAGNKTQQIKQIGNAVSVRKMKACVHAIMGDVAPAEIAGFKEAAE
ncbi:DNA cytosine methyltransferase [Brucella sp. TWI432]